MAKKLVYKLLITGPVNSGKTTLVSHLSDTQVAMTDVAATDEVARIKAMTTVGLDFGILRIDEEIELHLFGTPGQARFNFMWDILSKGALGAVFLIDSADPGSWDEARKMYDYYQQKVRLPVVFGATKQDLPQAKTPDEIAEALQIPADVPVLPLDARIKEQNKMIVLTLLENALAEALQQEDAGDDLGV